MTRWENFAMLLANVPTPDAGTGDLLLKLAMALIGLIVGAYHGVGLWNMLRRWREKSEDKLAGQEREAIKARNRDIDEKLGRLVEQIEEMKGQHSDFVNRVELGRAVKSIHGDHQKLEAYVYELAKRTDNGLHGLELAIEKVSGAVGDRIRKELEPFGGKIDDLIRTTSELSAITIRRERLMERDRGRKNSEDGGQ